MIDVGKYQTALSNLCGVEYPYMTGNQDVDAIAELIDIAARADVVNVRHGRWMEKEGYYECDICRSISLFFTDYCPNCGAKMDGE